jgi:hypothetical protein
MECYVGLDVSLKQTSICIVDQAGSVVREGVVDSDPGAISVAVKGAGCSTHRPRYWTDVHVAVDRARLALHGATIQDWCQRSDRMRASNGSDPRSARVARNQSAS